MKENERDAAVSKAAAILNYKNRSSRMLFDKLIEKEISPENAEYAVNKLIEYGYLNDEEYAQSVLRSCVSKGWGKQRCERKLTENKLPREIIDKVLSGFVTDEDELCRLYSSLCKDIADRKEREKTAAKLIRRGFSWMEIDAAQRRCIEENEEN